MHESVEQLETALTDPSLADRVEMVLRPVADDTYRAVATDGWVEFARTPADGSYRYDVVAGAGRDPLGDRAVDRLVGHGAERAAGTVDRVHNSYPHAFDSIAQFFDGTHAPDLVALHTGAHMSDGHLGQHGSLAAVQARAPFIAAGAGVRTEGLVDRSTRVVDLAPTIAALLGLDPHPHAIGPTGERRLDGLLARQDGDVDVDLLDGTIAEHVVVLLLDGCNSNLLLDAVDTGDAPTIAGLVRRGTAYRHGAFASLPTATLANHTTAVTGVHPGHSGVLHNTWVDRRTDQVPDLLALDQMFWAMQHLDPSVETLFGALTRSRPTAFSTASFEFCDTGATWSSFAEVRDGAGGALPELDDVTELDRDAAAGSEAYRFMSRVDHLSVEHTIEAWEQRPGNPLPTLSWCSLALTDEAGHESGPHGELARAAIRDSDARVARVLDAVERAGALERTAVLVIADHGMEQCDPTLDRPWSEDLAASGIAHREVGGGLFYVEGVEPAPR